MNTEIIDNPAEFLDDFVSISDQTICLEDSDFQRASQLAQFVPETTAQWRVYLNVLGVLGLQKWLVERTDDWVLDLSQLTLENPAISSILESATALNFGNFRLCLIAMESSWDDTVRIPRAVMDLPNYAAHFYIAVSIDEDMATIQGVLRHDQLSARCISERLKMQSDWSYEVPLGWFDPDIQHLLVYCNHLDPEAIALPADSTYSTAEVEAVSQALQALPTDMDVLNNYLSWPQARIILSHGALLEELYQRRSRAVERSQVSEVLESLSNAFIDGRKWINGQIDAIAEGLSWNALPLPVFAESSLRSTVKNSGVENNQLLELTQILDRLKQAGIQIPDNVGNPHARKFEVANNKLVLYAFVWLIEDTRNWSLLLVLIPQEGDRLASGLRFQVYGFDASCASERELLSDSIVSPTDEARYIYALMEGSWDERFIPTLAFREGDRLELTPFGIGVE